ncbi:efflux RND transporter periplasmic adaptor subunit [Colwelliaceae bacterium BS250]
MHSNNTHKKTKNKFVVILIPILIIVLGFVVLAVLSGMAEKPEKKGQINLAPIVDVLSIKSQDVVFSISSQGSVIPRTETALISEVSGAVTSVSKKFLVGGYFTKGEVLLEIDPITYEVAVLQSEARLGAADATYVEENARAEQAEDEWMLSGRPLDAAPILALRLPQLQKAQADVKAAQADLKQAQIKLARTKIIAPYDALLKEKNVDIGQYVTSGVQVAKTFAVDYAEIRLPIKQHDIAFIDLPKINQTMSANLAVDISIRLAGKTLHWPSKVSRYEGEVNLQSRVHYLIAHVEDPYNLSGKVEHGEELRAGTFVNAEIQGKKVASIIALPREVLRGAKSLHLINAENKLEVIDIEILRADKNNIYISSTIDTSKRVIITKLSAAVNGMSLRVNGEDTQEKAIKPPENSDVE